MLISRHARHQAARIARDLGPELFKHGPGTTRDLRNQAGCGPLVQPLAHALGRGDATDAQGLPEIHVVQHSGDALEIALAQAQQP